MNIDTLEGLRALYAAPGERALRKELVQLDPHCRHFIALSPFAVLSSANADGEMDASPRGGDPGFIRVLDERTLLVPDAPGNNRLDTLENLVLTHRIGLLLMVPGVDETLRINGRARLSTLDSHLDLCATERRRPKLVIVVDITQAYLHCAKALMRSRLWDPASHIERSRLPTMGRMISDQTGSPTAPETQQQMLDRYARDL